MCNKNDRLSHFLSDENLPLMSTLPMFAAQLQRTVSKLTRIKIIYWWSIFTFGISPSHFKTNDEH